MCCIERWAEMDSENGSYDSNCSSQETSDNEEIGFEGSKILFCAKESNHHKLDIFNFKDRT